MDTIIKQPKIEIAKELKELVATKTETESQVIVHINYYTTYMEDKIRIWNNTYLQCKDSGTKSKLLFSENIAVFPQWTVLKTYTYIEFTLIFENLPKGCNQFDLIENIPESGGFLFKDIKRNDANVYTLKLL